MTDQVDRAATPSGLASYPEHVPLWPRDGKDFHYAMMRHSNNIPECSRRRDIDIPDGYIPEQVNPKKGIDVVEGHVRSFEEMLQDFKENLVPDVCLTCFQIQLTEFCNNFNLNRNTILNVQDLKILSEHFVKVYKDKARFIEEHALHS